MLDIQDLRIHFRNAPPGKDAVKGICLHMDRGEILGLVGESGSGKTVTAMALAGLLSNAKTQLTGQIFFEGLDLLQASRETVRALRGKDIAVVFQEPMTSMDPVMRVGPQVEEALLVHTDLSPQERRQRALAAMADAELPDPETVYRKYPHELSGGMLQRAMVAAAIISEPKLLICDEPTTALDVTIQHQILKQMRSLQEEYGTSIIFITHDLGVVAELCDRVVVLYGGLVMEEAEINDLFENPLHPYTMGLLASIPGLTKDKSERLQSIPGSPPDMTKPPKGCPFASRCQFARNICAAECPPFVQVGSRQARCWLLQPDAPAEGNPLHEKLAEAERKAH